MHAKLIATVDLPTPPLQLETAIIFLTFFKPPSKSLSFSGSYILYFKTIYNF